MNKQQKKKRRYRGREREVLSYENVPIDEYQKGKETYSKKNVKAIITGIIIVAVIALIVFLVNNLSLITSSGLVSWFKYDVLNMSSSQGYPVKIVGSSVSEGNFVLSNGKPAYASDTSFIELTADGTEMFNSQLSFNDSVISTSGEYSLIYDVQGKGYQINNQKGLVYNGTMDDNIFCADINDDGSYVIVTEYSGYLSKLFAYNNKNKILYKYSFADYYITSVNINNGSDGAIATGISTDNGTECSAVYSLSFNKEEVQNTVKIEDCIIYDTEILASNRICAIGNTASYYINVSSGEVQTNTYEGKKLSTYDINKSRGAYAVALSRSGDGRNCDVIVYSSSGKETSNYSTDFKITSLSIFKNVVGVVAESKGYIINANGEVTHTCNVGNDGRQILLTSGDSGYLLGINEIRKTDFKSK